MLSKFLNPTNDLAFKRIFGTERNKDIAIHFLNDIFGYTSNPIEEITFLKTVQDPETIGRRVSLVDVMCKDAEGNRFIIEMQVSSEPGFEKRAQYYAAKAYIAQREKKMQYKDLKRVTFLSITGFTLFPEKTGYLSHHVILDNKTYDHDLKDFSFSFLELPKFMKDKHQLVSMTEKWAYFFKHAEETDEHDLPELIGSDGILERAYDELNRFSWTEAELWEYESAEMKRISEQTILEGAHEKGRFEGLEEGEQMGIGKGVRQIAKNMKKLGFSNESIQAATGLSQEEIEQL